MVWGTYSLKFMICSKSSSVQKVNCRRTSIRWQGTEEARFSTGFQEAVLHEVSFSVFSCVYSAQNHHMALWSERGDQASGIRMKKQLIEGHEHKRSHGQSPGFGLQGLPCLHRAEICFARCQVIFLLVTPLQAEFPFQAFPRLNQ